MHSFEVHSNESACRKSGHLGLEQVITDLHYFCVYQQVVSSSCFILYPIFILIPHYFLNFPFLLVLPYKILMPSPRSRLRVYFVSWDTIAAADVDITSDTPGQGRFRCRPFIDRRQKRGHSSDLTIAIFPWLVHRHNFLISPSTPFFLISPLSHMYPYFIPAPCSVHLPFLCYPPPGIQWLV